MQREAIGAVAGGEELKDVVAAGEGADGAAHTVPGAEELVSDVGDDEAVCAGDED